MCPYYVAEWALLHCRKNPVLCLKNPVLCLSKYTVWRTAWCGECPSNCDECPSKWSELLARRGIMWLRLVGSLKLQVSFAEYRLFYRALLQKRPIILRSLLIGATSYHVPSRRCRMSPTALQKEPCSKSVKKPSSVSDLSFGAAGVLNIGQNLEQHRMLSPYYRTNPNL